MPPRRPKCCTGTFPSTARRMSSTICPALISSERIPFTFPASFWTSFVGKGQRVIGRRSPTLMPCERAISMLFLAMRAAEPKATMAYSASSRRYSSKRTSFSSISLYFFWMRRLMTSISSERSSREVMMFGFLPPTRPVVAQGHSLMISSSVRRGLNGGRTTFSIIWPMAPSARIIAGLR